MRYQNFKQQLQKIILEYNHIKNNFEFYREEFESLSDVESKKNFYKSLLDSEELSQIESSTMSLDDWFVLRYIMWKRSSENIQGLKETMTAYTPSETVHLIKSAPVQNWFKKMRDFKLPENVEKIVFVPCAKGKRWDKQSIKRFSSSTYRLYHELIEQYPEIYFITISEPLSVVPQDHWMDFPLYDNPGLFEKDIPLQTDLWTKDWKTLEVDFKRNGKRFVPFGKKSKDIAIKMLADQMVAVMKNIMQDREFEFISMVCDVNPKKKTTHSLILDQVVDKLGITCLRLPKNPKARDKEEKKKMILTHLQG